MYRYVTACVHHGPEIIFIGGGGMRSRRSFSPGGDNVVDVRRTRINHLVCLGTSRGVTMGSRVQCECFVFTPPSPPACAFFFEGREGGGFARPVTVRAGKCGGGGLRGFTQRTKVLYTQTHTHSYIHIYCRRAR